MASDSRATDEAPDDAAGGEGKSGVQPAGEAAETLVDEPLAGEAVLKKKSRRSRRGGRGRSKKSVAVDSNVPEPRFL